MNNRIITPWNNPPAVPAKLKAMMDAAVESARDIYIRRVNELVDESLKDIHGGKPPSPMARRKHLRRLPIREGMMFIWKEKAILFVANPSFRNEGGKMQMDVIAKQLYKEETPLPPQLAGSN